MYAFRTKFLNGYLNTRFNIYYDNDTVLYIRTFYIRRIVIKSCIINYLYYYYYFNSSYYNIITLTLLKLSIHMTFQALLQDTKNSKYINFKLV